MATPAVYNPNLPVYGYYPTPAQPAAPAQPYYAPQMPADSRYGAAAIGNGPILQTGIAGTLATATKIVPAGIEAAVGAAIAIGGNSSRAMSGNVARIVAEAGEPLLRLTWGIAGNLMQGLLSLVTFQFPSAFQAFGRVFSEGFMNIGAMAKKLFQPLSLTAATSGGQRLGLGQALGAGISGGFKAFKSSVVWAVPAAIVNAFIDYKYRDQHDTKRLGTNLAADIVGYTATGMAGAAVGSMIGSMTMPIVGTIVGAGVGIILGLAHDKISRPMISDALYDAVR